MSVTTKSTAMVGLARSLIASRGAFFWATLRAGGVAGSVKHTAASTSEESPETQKMLVSGPSSAAPSLPFRMKMKGQLAAIHPMVPQSRTLPKSACASLRWWKQIELVRDRVGM
jgi:hypothetical protein